MKVLIGFVIVAAIILASESSDQARQDLRNFGSSDATVRLNAFYDLSRIGCPRCVLSQFEIIDGFQNAIRLAGIPKSDLVSGLNQLLATEAESAHEEADLPQTVCDYLGDLVQVVSFFHDRSSASVLMSFVSSGNMAQDGLAALGESGLFLVQAQLANNSADPSVRDASFRVARKMTLYKNLERFDNIETGRATLKQLLKGGLKESSHFARSEAVDGLTELGDSDVTPMLQSVAKNDPYSEQIGNRISFPIRDRAAKALAKLASAGQK